MINKTKNECETKTCHYSLTRTRFYNGMLLTDQHLRDEQYYHREILKRVNRNLFGSGIVCGLKVEPHPAGLCVKVYPGVALDCCGNLIEVCNCVNVDVSDQCKDQRGCIPSASQTKAEDFLVKKYLVLRYAEDETDPEPVLTPASDCKPAGEKPDCQASKIREGYCIELWDSCPCPEEDIEPEQELLQVVKRLADREQEKEAAAQAEANAPEGVQPAPATPGLVTQPRPITPAQTAQPADLFDELQLSCTPCGCCEDAVGLAELTIDCASNTVRVEYVCRRYVITPRMWRLLWSRRPRKSVPQEFIAAYKVQADLPSANMAFEGVEFDFLETPVVLTGKIEQKPGTKKASAKKVSTKGQPGLPK